MARNTTYPGTDRKFMVTSTQQDFFLTDDEWEITVIDPYRRQRRITKQDCFWDSDGRFYFTLEKTLLGRYYAWFKGWYEDDDYDKQTRQFTDGQLLCEAGTPACRCGREEPSGEGCRCRHVVQYREVFTVSVDGDDYLCGSDGRYILTSDGMRIAFRNPKRKQIEDMGKVILDTMTGEEFKRFIEGYNPDGQIDTVPEMIRAAQGISDEETIQQDVQEQIGDNQADSGDIDEIFGGASTAPTVPTQPIAVEEEEEP